ncbi:MAG: NUDIX domain-containing protein [Peptococcaceae bacterium]|nr:MAG: NUDIX domain-containing protein [Peptococcaceae bacterium]
MEELEIEREYPKQPIVAASVLVVREREVLLVRRAFEPSYGKWSVPGGLIELGETARDAATREVFEECGVDVAVGDLIEHIDGIVYNGDRVRFHYVILVFTGRYLSGVLRNSPENLDVRWVPLAELADYDITRTAALVLKKHVLSMNNIK